MEENIPWAGDDIKQRKYGSDENWERTTGNWNEIIVDGMRLRAVERFNYLDVIVSSDGDMPKEISAYEEQTFAYKCKNINIH